MLGESTRGYAAYVGLLYSGIGDVRAEHVWTLVLWDYGQRPFPEWFGLPLANLWVCMKRPWFQSTKALTRDKIRVLGESTGGYAAYVGLLYSGNGEVGAAYVWTLVLWDYGQRPFSG